MKKLLCILLFILPGCFGTTNTTVPNNPDYPEINCSQVEKKWWGERGEDPSASDIWKCHNWCLDAL